MSANNQRPSMDTAKDNTTASHAQVTGAGSSSGSGNAAGGVSRSTSSSSKRSQFRQSVGIPDTDKDLPNQTLRRRLERAYHAQTRFYYFVASASHGMLWLQIAIGATLTALGTTNSNAARIAITVLGAINTLVAGLLTFLKSRNQPNRALQFRNALRGVYEDLWMIDAESQRDDFDVNKQVDYLWSKYKEARSEAEANYPDLWVSLNRLVKSQDPSKHPDSQLNDVPVADGSTAAIDHRTSDTHEPLLAKTRP